MAMLLMINSMNSGGRSSAFHRPDRCNHNCISLKRNCLSKPAVSAAPGQPEHDRVNWEKLTALLMKGYPHDVYEEPDDSWRRDLNGYLTAGAGGRPLQVVQVHVAGLPRRLGALWVCSRGGGVLARGGYVYWYSDWGKISRSRAFHFVFWLRKAFPFPLPSKVLCSFSYLYR